MYVKLNDLAVKARESSSLFLSTYDNPMRFRNSNYNKDHSMTMKSKSDQTSVLICQVDIGIVKVNDHIIILKWK